MKGFTKKMYIEKVVNNKGFYSFKVKNKVMVLFINTNGGVTVFYNGVKVANLQQIMMLETKSVDIKNYLNCLV